MTTWYLGWVNLLRTRAISRLFRLNFAINKGGWFLGAIRILNEVNCLIVPSLNLDVAKPDYLERHRVPSLSLQTDRCNATFEEWKMYKRKLNALFIRMLYLC